MADVRQVGRRLRRVAEGRLRRAWQGVVCSGSRAARRAVRNRGLVLGASSVHTWTASAEEKKTKKTTKMNKMNTNDENNNMSSNNHHDNIDKTKRNHSNMMDRNI